VNLTVPSHLAAYSNSPVSSNTDLGNGQRTVSFTPTMKMSTYLVAFIIGPFEETEALDVDGVPLRIVFPLGNAHLTGHALEAGAFALRFFSNYFDIPYPATSWTWSRYRTSCRARWRTSVASRTACPIC